MGIVFKENPDKKLRRNGETKFDKKAVLSKVNVTIQESIASKNNEDQTNGNKLCIGKLVQIVHFLLKNNLSLKRLYPKFVEFLSSELQEPIKKHYLDTRAKTYISCETCVSLIHSLGNYF